MKIETRNEPGQLVSFKCPKCHEWYILGSLRAASPANVIRAAAQHSENHS